MDHYNARIIALSSSVALLDVGFKEETTSNKKILEEIKSGINLNRLNKFNLVMINGAMSVPIAMWLGKNIKTNLAVFSARRKKYLDLQRLSYVTQEELVVNYKRPSKIKMKIKRLFT